MSFKFLKEILTQALSSNSLVKIVISNPKINNRPKKIEVKPVPIKNQTCYQITKHENNKALHTNWNSQECLAYCLNVIEKEYKQTTIFTSQADYHVLSNKSDELKILRKKPSLVHSPLIHNRNKNYLIPENTPIPFLIKLGVMNQQGNVLPKRRDKFKQINRFLEMIQDVIPFLPKDKTVRIIDFGCGKGYLTFAMYYLLHTLNAMDVEIVGIDLKSDVIHHCQNIAKEIGYGNLIFTEGNMQSYQSSQPFDMVVALHACDIATDIALEHGIKWKSAVILAAPCCHKEISKHIDSQSLGGLLHYGILKERLAALATDAVRSLVLETKGYKTQILEFIDSEHTPKNLLIRAVFGNSQEARHKAKQRLEDLNEALSLETAYVCKLAQSEIES